MDAPQLTPDSLADSDNADRYNVPALERGLRLLSQFNRQTPTLSAPDLVQRLNLPRSTVFRILTTLESMGFVQRVDGGRSYGLGLGVLRLGFEYLASLQINELGTPILERLRDDLNHPCVLVLRDEQSIVYVARVSPPSPFISSVSVGTRLPAHATVLGRVLLSELSLPELQALYPTDNLPSFSSNTPKTVQELFALVQADAQRGYAVSEGFFEANISTIAAPVRDHSGRIVAALGVTTHAGNIDLADLDPLVAQTCAAAAQLSASLNYRPRQPAAGSVAT